MSVHPPGSRLSAAVPVDDYCKLKPSPNAIGRLIVRQIDLIMSAECTGNHAQPLEGEINVSQGVGGSPHMAVPAVGSARFNSPTPVESAIGDHNERASTEEGRRKWAAFRHICGVAIYQEEEEVRQSPCALNPLRQPVRFGIELASG